MGKNVVVFDIDGTLANNDHRQHHLDKSPKDWDGFFSEMDKDTLNEAVTVIHGIMAEWLEFNGKEIASRFTIILLTGRTERWRLKTEDWLDCHDIIRDQLIMRADDDRREDHEYKEAWLKESGLKDQILFVIEDRSRVVDMWRRNGITCFQCAKGDY